MVIVKVEYALQSQSIIIPDQAKREGAEYWGVVQSVGPEYPAYELKKGDKIVFNRGEGYRIRPYYGNWNEEYYAVRNRWVQVKI